MVNNKVLITGGAGYLGSVLIEHLLRTNNKVTCLDNLRYHQKSPFNFVSNPNFCFIYGDSRDKSLLEKEVTKHDVIIPLAAVVGMKACNQYPSDAISTNFSAICLINELRSPEQKLIYPNTNSGYGSKTGEHFCTEETPLEPISLYGKTKCDAEDYLIKNEKEAITLRLATVFGTSLRMRTDLLVNNFVLKALEEKVLVLFEPHFKRNYIHIRDVARCFEHCINNYDSMKNKSYNLGLEEANLSKLELAEKIREYIPETRIIINEFGNDPDKRDYIVSNQRILSTGFIPKYSLNDGILELIKGYDILLRDNPQRNS